MFFKLISQIPIASRTGSHLEGNQKLNTDYKIQIKTWSSQHTSINTSRLGCSTCFGSTKCVIVFIEFIKWQPLVVLGVTLLTNPLVRNFTMWKSQPQSCYSMRFWFHVFKSRSFTWLIVLVVQHRSHPINFLRMKAHFPYSSTLRTTLCLHNQYLMELTCTKL